MDFSFYFLECNSFRDRKQKKLVLLQLWIMEEKQNKTETITPKSRSYLCPSFTPSLLQVGWQQHSSHLKQWNSVKLRNYTNILCQMLTKDFRHLLTVLWEEQLISLYQVWSRHKHGYGLSHLHTNLFNIRSLTTTWTYCYAFLKEKAFYRSGVQFFKVKTDHSCPER